MVSTLVGRGDEVCGFDHAALDITNEAAIVRVFQTERPELVINCAAWTNVDGCETDREHAMQANARGPELLAQGCAGTGALFITISTDYVFDGSKEGFYTQRDQPQPLSFYGQSKLAGEHRAQIAWANTIVVRSGYIFGSGGTNFLSVLLPRLRRGERLKAISNMVGTPTYAPDLAQRIAELAQLNLPGIFHVVNEGSGASFAEFAQFAMEIAGLDAGLVESVPLESLPRPAARPRNSKLRCLISGALGLRPMPSWQDSLKRFVAEESE